MTASTRLAEWLKAVQGWKEEIDHWLHRLGRQVPRADTRRRVIGYLQSLLGEVERRHSWQVAEYAGHPTPSAFQPVLGRANGEVTSAQESEFQAGSLYGTVGLHPCGLGTGLRPYDMSNELLRFDTPAAVADWYAIDDHVMGGVSHSRFRYDPAGHAVFEGVVLLEHHGGFASVRSRPQALGRPRVLGYGLEVCGDGKRYKLSLRTDEAFDGVSYQTAFAPPADTWSVVRLPLAAFVPTFRGRCVLGAPPLDSARVRQIGFLIADRQVGAFALAIRSLQVE